MRGIITDRGKNWEQLRWQLNIEGRDDWEDSDDTLEYAFANAQEMGCTTITVHLDK